jgi:hypothetical protein
VTSDGYNKGFQKEFEVQGTRDDTPFLCIPTAIGFYRSLNIEKVRKYNHSLVRWAGLMLAEKWGTETLVSTSMIAFMCSVRIPIRAKAGDTGSEDVEVDRYESIIFTFFIEMLLHTFNCVC